jgi:hypothetical protein
MPSPYDDLYDPMGVPLSTEERIRRLMELRRQQELAAIPTMLADELPPADALGADVSSLGVEAVQSPFDGGVSYRPIPRKAQAPYVGYRQGRG